MPPCPLTGGQPRLGSVWDSQGEEDGKVSSEVGEGSGEVIVRHIQVDQRLHVRVRLGHRPRQQVARHEPAVKSKIEQGLSRARK